MKKIFAVLFLVLFVCAAKADYSVYIGNAVKWSHIDSHTIVLYSYSKAICIVKARYAYIYSSSDIRFLSDYISNWDYFLLDGHREEITSVERL